MVGEGFRVEFTSSPAHLILVLLSLITSHISTFHVHAIDPQSHPKTLVLYEQPDIKSTHSIFFQQLKARGHELTFASIYDDSPRLERYGDYPYSNLILLCPNAEDFGEHISTNSIISFIDSGRHVLMVLNENTTEPHREVLNDIGVEVDEEGTRVQDHFHSQPALDGLLGLHQHTVVTSTQLTSARSVFPTSIPRPISPVLFRGIGHSFIDDQSPLAVPILTAEATAYSGEIGKIVADHPQAVGEEILLISGVQTLNNARVVVVGSLDLLSDDFIHATLAASGDGKAKAQSQGQGSGNGVVVEQVTKWVFGDQGILRARELKHKQVSGNEHNPHGYRVLDQVQFSILLEEWDGNRQGWVPFLAEDVQLEFTMIDPYFRVTLPHNQAGIYSHNFTIPDVYGVYKFVIDYHRIGYSHLVVSHTVPVHPFRHDEFERFIPVAYPYYAAVFTLMAAFFVFGIVFLYQKE